jgi:hypothetical protein
MEIKNLTCRRNLALPKEVIVTQIERFSNEKTIKKIT